MSPHSEIPQISLVVPVFDEEENLSILAREIAEGLKGFAYEVIFVDDGSTDGSLDVLCELRRQDDRRRIVRLAENRGQSAAFCAGFQAARAGVVVTLDADLQNDPADIPELLEALTDCDMVSGVRMKRRDGWLRRAASRIANRVRNAVVHDTVSDVGCSLKAYRSEFLRRLKMFDGMHRYLPALLELQGARIREIPVHHRPRRHGRSKYTIFRRLLQTLPDLLAVVWMRHRWIDDRLAAEVDANGDLLAPPVRSAAAGPGPGDDAAAAEELGVVSLATPTPAVASWEPGS